MMLNLHVPKLPTRKVLRAEVGEGSVEGKCGCPPKQGGRGQLQMLLLHVACCFRRFWLCGKLNASVVWLTDDKDWSGLAGGSNGLPPLPPTPEQANTCYARERDGEKERERGRELSLDNLGEASLLLLGMFTVLQACRQQLLLQPRTLLVLLVAGLFTMSTRGGGRGCLRHV